MVTKEDIQKLEKKVILGIELLGKVVTENFKFVNDRLTTMGEGNKLYLDLINERITELLETEDAILKQLVEPKPVKIAEDVDFEKTIRHASPGIEGTISEEAYQKAQKPKPKKVYDNEQGAKVEFEFEEYINIDGEFKSFVIYHPDSKQMVKYIGKTLLFNGGVGASEDGLFLKKDANWVLKTDWTVKKT